MTKETTSLMHLTTYDSSCDRQILLYEQMPYTRDTDICSLEHILYTTRRVIKLYTYQEDNFHYVSA